MGSIAMEEYELMKDPKYRVYVSAVDKALKNFDYTSEWADLISALGKLNKVLLGYQKFPVIPRRIKISKRLAQCMHPALPSGVHLKALETYDIIFRCMGTNRLSHELFIYSAGLFPLLGHSAMNVRPSLLKVYETHFVPLGERLRPGLSGFLSGVLPGLEEGSDHFDRTNMLLEQVCEGAGNSHYYGCLWQCMAANSAIRLPAISFVLAHFNKKLSMEDQIYVMGTNVDIMVSALCGGARDASALVQRSTLDLLLVGFPVHNTTLLRGDMVRLVTAALNTILRRDVSLNRRVYAWLLGTEVNVATQHNALTATGETAASSDDDYFNTFSRELLIQSIRSTLSQGLSGSGKTPHDLRAYRILVSLLDKPDIGPVVLDDILYEVFRALYAACGGQSDASQSEHSTGQPYRNCQELLKSANLLFSSLEPSYIWQYLASLFTNACDMEETKSGAVLPVGSGPPNLLEVCLLAEFLLDTVSLALESCLDSPGEHLPGLFLHVSTRLTDRCQRLSGAQLAAGLKLAAKLLARTQTRPDAQAKESKLDVPENQSEDRLRANSDLSEYKGGKGKSKMKKSKTDSKLRKLAAGGKNHADSSPVLLSVVYNHEDANEDAHSMPVGNSLRSHLSASHLERSPGEAEVEEAEVDEVEAAVVTLTVPTKQQTMLEQCKRQYETFFVRFVSVKDRILPGELHELYPRLLEIERRDTDQQRTEKLVELLESCLLGKFAKTQIEWPARSVTCVQTTGKEWEVRSGCGEWEEPLRLAANLLVELSTFPSCWVVQEEEEEGCSELPAWLQALLACCCYLPTAMQLTSVTALMDLVGLLRDTGLVDKGPGSGAVAVVVEPLLKQAHLRFILEETNVVKMLSTSLWRQLQHSTCQQACRCVDLLHRLHSAVEDDVVEAVVGASLVAEEPDERAEAFQRFATLWHVGRDLTGRQAGRGYKQFDKSLLKMLDLLAPSESSPLKLLAQSWLLHSLVRGDIARLLDPLLVALFDPNTARVSVVHVSVNTTPTANKDGEEKNGELEDSARIYAISSEDGHVIYHVQDARKISRGWNNGSKRALAVKTMSGGEDTRHYLTTSRQPPSRHISVFVNPFTGSATDSTEDDSADACHRTKHDSATEEEPAEILHSTDSSTTKLTADDIDSDSVVENSVDSRDIKSEAAKKLATEDDGSMHRLSYELSNIRRWSNEDLEISTPADEFFNTDSSASVVESILDDILASAVARCESKLSSAKDVNLGIGFHPLHQHMLLYCGVYDSNHTLYALQTVRSVLLTNARMFLCAAATTGLANMKNANYLITLLARHRKSVFGKSFHGDPSSVTEYTTAYRSSMYLEVLIAVCLYFARSFYPNLGQMRLTPEEIAGNRQVQLVSAELLMLISVELILIVRDSGKGFACYIADLLTRCKVQKIVLHCVLASVYAMKTSQDERTESQRQRTFTEEIVSFNDPPAEGNEDAATRCRFRCSEHSESFQIQLLRLLLALIMLEHQVNLQKGDSNSDATKEAPSSATGESQLRYVAGVAIPHQPMFLASVLTALELPHARHLHQHWTTLVTSSLPYMGPSLTRVVVRVVTQLCFNIEQLAECYRPRPNSMLSCCLQCDYTLTQLEALTVLCHFCLLDSSQQPSVFGQPTSAGASLISGANPGQIFNNLIHVFVPTPLAQDGNAGKEKAATTEAHLAARRTVLSHLPRILASVASLWQAVINNHDWEQQNNVLGNPRVVKHQLLEFLSPISLHHGVNFLAAVAVAWHERRSTQPNRKVIPVMTASHQVLVYLVSAIRVMPIDTLVQTVHQVVKQPPPIQGGTKDLSLEVSVLELFYCYIQSGPALADSWPSLLGLLRDGPTLTPPAQFLVLAVLNQYIQKCPPLADKKDQRDLQDITARLVESCTQIAGACLEQTTWLRRNLAVREDDLSVTGTKLDGVVNSLAQYSVQAQQVLAELLAPLLDVSYGSQEKDRVVALLSSLMMNIVPYLKNHTSRNVMSYRACSQLLASLSSYQYTRKAWRKDVFDLLLDPALFQMEASCLAYWKTIVDNLMTHDNSTFRDLMTRVSVAQSNSLSIFSSREAEYEVRAQLLKRLAFVILCSETDQYHKYMPEIQERLADSLRLSQAVPSCQAQVLLCFRALLLRMSAQHVTSLWPIVISEMVQIFLHIEQELSTDSDQFSSHIRVMTSLDAAWVVNSNNGLHAHGHPHWLQLQLAAAKLLDTAVLLPAQQLPQFQMYRWAFVGGDGAAAANNNEDSARSSDFVPHVVRIARLMDTKYACPFVPLTRRPGRLLLTASSIKSLQELRPFFSALGNQCDQGHHPVNIADLEAVVEADFLERLAAK